ncbi:hypothetical protein OAB00_04085, partial [Akkermansiaceae bacterium]|nr:hypothetical protein [Akkermansiaceae bacterium]
YHYKYRHYKSDIGRWLGRDPIEDMVGSIKDIFEQEHFHNAILNQYAFVENNPIRHWDNYGLLKWVKLSTKWTKVNGNALPTGNREGGLYYGPDLEYVAFAFTLPRVDGSVKCKKKEKDCWNLNSSTMKYRSRVWMRNKTYIESAGSNVAWVKRGENDHVKDFDLWASQIAKPLAQKIEDNQKKITYKTKSACEIAALARFRAELQASAINAIKLTIQKWDDTNKHSWGHPNARP